MGKQPQHSTKNRDVLWPLQALNLAAVDEKCWAGSDTVCVSSKLPKKTVEIDDGSDTATIGAWPENGIFGTQLAPNRKAKPLHK